MISEQFEIIKVASVATVEYWSNQGQGFGSC